MFRRTLVLTFGLAVSAEAKPANTFDQVLNVAVGDLQHMSVRDRRDELSRDLVNTLIRKKLCDRAVEVLQSNPDTLTMNPETIAFEAAESQDPGCIVKVANVLATADLPPSGFVPSSGPEVHHLGGALLSIAGRAEGAAVILQAEAAMDVPGMPLPQLPDTAPARLQSLVQGLELRDKIRQKLSGRTHEDERLWFARDSELGVYSYLGNADKRYIATLNRLAVAALSAGSKVPAGTLDDLSTRYIELGQRDRATMLMDAAIRNEVDPTTQHSLASRAFDMLVNKQKYREAAAFIDAIDPIAASSLVDLAVVDITQAQPTVLVPYVSAFDRWSNGHPTRVTVWLGELALQLANRHATREARTILANVLARLKNAQSGEQRDVAENTATRLAALLGDDDIAWSLATSRRADHDVHIGLLSAIAVGALDAGRGKSADRALTLLSKEDQGFVYEGALGGALDIPPNTRRMIVERGLAFAAGAEPREARRIYAALSEQAARDLDLPDLTSVIISAAPQALRGSLAVEAAHQIDGSVAVAKEKNQPAIEAEGRRRALALTRTALTNLAMLTDDEKAKLSLVCAILGDFDASRRVADALQSPYNRERAYITLVGRMLG